MSLWKGLGRLPHFDPQNLDYKIEDRNPALGTARGVRGLVAAVPTPPRKSRKWRALWRGDQGSTPHCTAYGTLTALHCLPVTHTTKPLADPETFFEEIRVIDVAAGRDFGGDGATTLAAMQAAERRGWIGAYLWTYTADVAFDTVSLVEPAIFGTNWYEGMFRRDAEGIARIGPRDQNPVGGHLWACNGIDVKRGLVRYASTWGDGDYWLPMEDVARLLEREDGECVVVRELPDPRRAAFLTHGIPTE